MPEDFPKTYKCPKCGSEKTVINVACAPYKANGQIPLGQFRCMEAKMTPLLDPRAAKISYPAILTHWDLCYDCGEWYCSKVSKIDVPIAPPMTPQM